MSGKTEIVAKTFYGLEKVLASEITSLGGTGIEVLNRAVRFQGDKELIYKANLYLRTALRILVPVINADIRNQVDLYARVREFSWEQYIRPGMTLAVDTFLNSSTFTHSHFVSLRTKDAIVDRIRDLTGRRPSINTSDPDLMVNVHLASNRLTVSLDTSGLSLHKRGYRLNDTGAPLNEILAAGMIILSGWEGKTDFYDPMCGSGTLGIEAALIARSIPPGIFRKQFGFEKSPDFDRDLWEKIFDNVMEQPWEGSIISSDISKPAVRLAFENAKRALVHKNIEFRGIDFRKYPKIPSGATVILNPPYGERMAKNEIYNFYRAIGNTMKNSFSGSKVWIISSNLEALKYIGLRPAKKYKLFNGALECRYQGYEMYSGSKENKFKNSSPGSEK